MEQTVWCAKKSVPTTSIQNDDTKLQPAVRVVANSEREKKAQLILPFQWLKLNQQTSSRFSHYRLPWGPQKLWDIVEIKTLIYKFYILVIH